MKISELPDCPEWLKNASTKNANVDWGCGPNSWVLWLGGEWLGGVWRGGVWLGGEWLGGDWLGGVWRGGVWRGGDWLGGEWLGGVWRGGVWRGGVSCARSKWHVVQCDGKISIGCKTKTIDDWDAWFAGNETFDTPRNSEEFKLIRANYEAVKAFAIWSTKETT